MAAEKKVTPVEILGGGGKKAPKKRKHRPKNTSIEHHDDGSHTTRHTFHPGEDGSTPPPEVSYASKDLDELHDGLEHHLGEPNVDEEAAGV